jgi:hypothetical protein
LMHHLRWASQGHASILSVDGDRIVLCSTAPSPPGSRIEGAPLGASHAPLRVKVSSCRRQSDGDFVIEGRLLDATREVRQILQAIVDDRPSA